MTTHKLRDIVIGDLHVELPLKRSENVVLTADGQCECCGEPAKIRVTMSVAAFRELGTRTLAALRA